MTALSNKLLKLFLENNIIDSDDADIYEFGIYQGLNLIFNIISAIIIGFVMGMLWESIIFLVFYTPLRCYAGGYHAKSRGRCYLYSLLIVASSMGLIYYLKGVFYAELGLIAAGAIFIWLWAPLEHELKPLVEEEKAVYCSKVRRILVVETVLFLLAVLAGIYQIAVCIAAAEFVAGCMLVAEVVRLKLLK